jgi:aminoglycoside 3-N-acetyltransferase
VSVDRERLVRDLARLGLQPGAEVLVNCSMRQIGFVEGGAGTLFSAIRQLIGPSGTVVVPTQTANNSTTSRYHLAVVRGMSEWQRRRFIARIPGFHRETSPSYRMGLFAEYIRCHPEAVRSDHPQTSFAAVGPSAGRLMAGHRLRSHLGEQSPLAMLYASGGYTLLLGVGYDRCTTFHLAEYRLPAQIPRRLKKYRCFVQRDDRRECKVFRAVDLDDSDFPELGKELDGHSWVRSGPVGYTFARLIPVREAVDFAIDWMARQRSRSGH